jgi:hypothetical protein
MKSIAQLVLFFTVCFLLIFAAAGAVRFLQLSVDAAKAIPVGPPLALEDLISAIRELLPLALYVTVLLTLSYAARRNTPFLLATIILFILAGAFTFGSVWGLRQAKNLKSMPGTDVSRESSFRTLGRRGLILSQRNTVIVLLGNPDSNGGPRVISYPGEPLIYQEEPASPESAALPQAPFRNETSFLTSGIFSDFSLTADRLESRFGSGLFSFGLYGGALILLLLSLRFVMELSSWPLANLFSGAVVFRGILAVETFIDSREIQSFLKAFLGPRIPSFYISPIVFGALGLIVIIYTLLVYSARGKNPKTRNRKGRRP